jgi:NAD(P)-dependent dehydrogenase (short-subunit alcohol dehydrogenase family)
MASKTWFITGCSSGLGRELAKAALSGGDNVVLTARNPDSVADLLKGNEDRAIGVRLDVTSPEAIEAAVAAAQSRFGTIDVLVNNAGYAHVGTVEEVPMDAVYKLFETDLFGPVRLIKAVLPGMRERRSGWIVNIASVGGLIGFPMSGYYSSVKFALVGLTEALRTEVDLLGIQVGVVEPGPVNTGFSEKSVVMTVPETPDYDLEASFQRSGITDWVKNGADPALGAAALVEVVNSGELPPHLVIGAAGVQTVLQHSRDRLALFEQWADFGRLEGAQPPRPTLS